MALKGTWFLHHVSRKCWKSFLPRERSHITSARIRKFWPPPPTQPSDLGQPSLFADVRFYPTPLRYVIYSPWLKKFFKLSLGSRNSGPQWIFFNTRVQILRPGWILMDTMGPQISNCKGWPLTSDSIIYLTSLGVTRNSIVGPDNVVPTLFSDGNFSCLCYFPMCEKGVTWRWQQFLMFHKACYCWETRSNRLVSTDFLAKIAKNVYRPHFWIKCKGIFEGWITWKLFFLIFSILFFYFFAFSVDGNFSVIYPSVNVIWNVKFFEGVPAVNYTNSVLWIF